MMVVRMKNAAKAHGYDISIMATGADEFVDDRPEADILLVAPQITYQYQELKDEFSDEIKVIKLIDRSDYGAMNGEKVLVDAMTELLKG